METTIKEPYDRIFELAKPYLNTRSNEIHTRICYGFAGELLEKENGDPEIVIPAILLHDVGWIEVPEELQLKAFGPKASDAGINRVHEIEGVKTARSILSQIDYDPEKTAEILEIIEGHDSRLWALSTSDQIVKDADKLFRFSERGFAIDCERFAESPKKLSAWLRQQIDTWMFTETAKQLARAELDKKKLP